MPVEHNDTPPLIDLAPSPELYEALRPYVRIGGRFDHLLRWALLVDDTHQPRFVGTPVQSSDGFLFGGFVDADGNAHMGAFWGVACEYAGNTHEFARYCVANRVMTVQAADRLQHVVLNKLGLLETAGTH